MASHRLEIEKQGDGPIEESEDQAKLKGMDRAGEQMGAGRAEPSQGAPGGKQGNGEGEKAEPGDEFVSVFGGDGAEGFGVGEDEADENEEDAGEADAGAEDGDDDVF
jgi:hypothetical protein